MSLISAGIVTYNPDVKRLESNLEAVAGQVECVFVCDNASANISEIRGLCDKYSAVLISNEKNLGLGTAFNKIFNARSEDTRWILTLDQDSVIPVGFIEACKRYIERPKTGIICPQVFEKNAGIYLFKGDPDKPFELRNRAITSASLVNVDAYNAVGGYDEYLFIDYVDFDFCAKLTLNGYEILQMNDTVLSHELGVSSAKKFLFWKIKATDHSAMRDYYIGRNITIYRKRYKGKLNTTRDFLSLMKRRIFIILFWEEKKEKLSNLKKGVRDGKAYNG